MEPTGTPDPPQLPAVPEAHPPARRADPDLEPWVGDAHRGRGRSDDDPDPDRDHDRAPRDEPAPEPAPAARPPGAWVRLRARGWRVAIGAGIGAAALLLIPFFLFPTLDFDDPVDQWWPPFAVGLGVLAVLSLLRLDRLLKGWTWHVAGLAFVAALVMWTGANPWAWAFAASLGLLIAGVLRLPQWQLAAVAGVLCVVSVVGFSLRASDIAEQQAEISAHQGDVARAVLGGVDGAEKVQPLLDRAISGSVADPAPVCRILGPDAERVLLEQTRTTDCAAAVGVVHARYAQGGLPAPVTAVPRSAPAMTSQPGYTLDLCSSAWAGAAGPQLGRVVVSWTTPTARRYAITGFQPC